MVMKSLVILSMLALTACGNTSGDGGSVVIINPPADECVESSIGLFKGSKHNGWCQLDNPHYDPAACDEQDPPVVDDPGDDAEEIECPSN